MNEIDVDKGSVAPLIDRMLVIAWSHKAWFWPVWLIVLALWTAALVTPQPAEFSHENFSKEVGFTLAKSLHICVYALLAASGLFLPLPRGRRWLPIAVLSCHGVLTEIIQLYVPLRYGCWQDVVIDHIGIAAGVIVAWFLERQLRERLAISGSLLRPAPLLK